VGSKILFLFPDFLKPYVVKAPLRDRPEPFALFRLAGRLFTNVPNAIRKALKHLKPTLDERMQKIEEYGSDYPDKPVGWFFHEILPRVMFCYRLICFLGSWMRQKAMNVQLKISPVGF
jgi:hypothetical protein